VFPKNGPTKEQISFISSRENLGAYGYGQGAVQPPLFDRQNSDESDDSDLAPPEPGFLSTPVPAQTRGRRSSSVSTQPSPLARAVAPSTPSSPTLTIDPTAPARQLEEPQLVTTPSSPPPGFSSAPPSRATSVRNSHQLNVLPTFEVSHPTPIVSCPPSPAVPAAEMLGRDELGGSDQPDGRAASVSARRAHNFSAISEASVATDASFHTAPGSTAEA